MRFTVAATAALVAGVSATYPHRGSYDNDDETTYVTEVVSKYSTYCPSATEVEHGGKTYTVTSATTLTLDCPCTITKPAPTSAPVYTTSAPVETHPAPTTTKASSTAAPVPSSSSKPVASPSSYTHPAETHPAPTTAAPSSYTAPAYTPPVAYPTGNGTVTTSTRSPVGTTSAVTSRPPAFTGAAGKAAPAAGLAAIFGLAALAL